MAKPPQYLTLKDHRDDRHRFEVGSRWVVVALLGLVLALALLGLLGQSPRHSTGTGEAATLDVSAPTRLRGGLYYQGRFTIRAERELRKATLLLHSGWLDGITINSYVPEPIGFAYRDGKLALDFGHVAAGDLLQARLQFQVNPTTVGRRSQSVELHDDEEPVAAVERTVTIFP